MIETNQVTILLEDEFEVTVSVFITEEAAIPFVHLYVFEWNRACLTKMKALWPEVRAKLPNMVFCMSLTGDEDKFERFVSHFGWKYIGVCPNAEGELRNLYVHYK